VVINNFRKQKLVPTPSPRYAESLKEGIGKGCGGGQRIERCANSEEKKRGIREAKDVGTKGHDCRGRKKRKMTALKKKTF